MKKRKRINEWKTIERITVFEFDSERILLIVNGIKS
jgi:hypothetical protein